MKRLLLCGYFGFGNTGDEALLDAAVTWLRERDPALTISVLTADPARTASRLGVDVVPRGPLRRIRAAMTQMDVIALGPGGLFQDLTSVRSNAYYAALGSFACSLGKPLVLIGQGVGPLRSRLARRLARATFRRASLITVRDEESAALVRELASECWPIVAADTAFLLPPDTRRDWRAQIERVVGSQRPIIGLSVRTGARIREDDLERLVECAKAATRHREMAWLVVSFGGEADQRPSENVTRLLNGRANIWPEALEPREWLGLIGALDGLVAMRLHAILFAARSGVPVAGIAYDPKVRALLAQLGCTPAVDLLAEDPWPGAAERIAADLFSEGRGERLRRAAQGLASRAELGLAPLLDLPGRNRGKE